MEVISHFIVHVYLAQFFPILLRCFKFLVLFNQLNIFSQYLDQLIQKDIHGTQNFHGQLVKLYAEFDRPKLLPFLRRSEFYPLQTAWEECEIRDFVEEQVFLLGQWTICSIKLFTYV